MSPFRSDITSEFREELKEIIRNSTIEILDSIFGCRVFNTETAMSDSEAIIANVELWQGLESLKFYFVFQKTFIETLLSLAQTGMDADQLSNKEVCEDAAREIANIISNKIKAFINTNGYQFLIDLPEAQTSAYNADSEKKERVICINFANTPEALPPDSILCVDMLNG